MANKRNLMGLLAIAAAALFVSQVRAQGSLRGLDFLSAKQRQKAIELAPVFNQVDRYLNSIKTTSSAKLIEGIKSIYHKKYLNPLARLKPVQCRLRDALKLFAQLKKALNSCDLASYKALAMNQLAMGADLSTSGGENEKKSRRVLQDCAARHALSCRRDYERNFKALEPRGGDPLADNVATVRKIFGKLDPGECRVHPLGSSAAEDVELSKKCLKQMAEIFIAASEPSIVLPITLDNLLAITKKFNENIRKFLIAPCRSYKGHFIQVFAPAIFDSTAIDDSGLHPYDGPFLEGLRFFRICEHASKNVDSLSKLLLNEISDMYQGEKKL